MRMKTQSGTSAQQDTSQQSKEINHWYLISVDNMDESQKHHVEQKKQ